MTNQEANQVEYSPAVNEFVTRIERIINGLPENVRYMGNEINHLGGMNSLKRIFSNSSEELGDYLKYSHSLKPDIRRGMDVRMAAILIIKNALANEYHPRLARFFRKSLFRPKSLTDLFHKLPKEYLNTYVANDFKLGETLLDVEYYAMDEKWREESKQMSNTMPSNFNKLVNIAFPQKPSLLGAKIRDFDLGGANYDTQLNNLLSKPTKS